MKVLTFSAQVTATDVFRMVSKGEIWFDAWSSNWNSATLTLTIDPNNSGTYHDFTPNQDSTTPLIGAAFTLTYAGSGGWSNPIILGPGTYGITIAGATPTVPIKVHAAHKFMRAGDGADPYQG